MRLYLVRHGQTQSNVDHLLDTKAPGAPLTAEGLSQAASVAEDLADVPLEAVYASNLTRAQQTAEAIANKHGLEVSVLDGLREISAGAEEGNVEWDAYINALFAWGDDMDAKLPDGESGNEFVSRYTAAINQIAANHEVAAAVSHGAAMRTWVPAVAKNMTVGTGMDYPMPNTGVIILDGSPTAGWTVTSWAGEPI